MTEDNNITAEQQSGYRWVMAGLAGLVMTTSFISLTAFGVAAPEIAASLHRSASTVTTYGVDSFSIGLFVAFFIGHGGLFDTRLKKGVILAQLLLIVPQFLIPVVANLWVITIFRFLQGLMIMMLALFSLQLAGWFRPKERARSLALTLGAITLGGAVGGLLAGQFSTIRWQDLYYLTGGIMIVGALPYVIFAREATVFQASVAKEKKETTGHPSAWRLPLTWVMGFAQIPVAWTLFSIGGFLPLYTRHLGYSSGDVTNITLIWGFAGFAAAVGGSIVGDALIKNASNRQEVFRARLQILTVADILMGIGSLLILVIGHLSFGWLILAIIFNACLMIFPPNYWACPATIFPLSLIGAGAFGMGLISNSASAIGPLVSSAMVPSVGWTGVFAIMVVLAVVGIILNVIASKLGPVGDLAAQPPLSTSKQKTLTIIPETGLTNT